MRTSRRALLASDPTKASLRIQLGERSGGLQGRVRVLTQRILRLQIFQYGISYLVSVDVNHDIHTEPFSVPSCGGPAVCGRRGVPTSRPCCVLAR